MLRTGVGRIPFTAVRRTRPYEECDDADGLAEFVAQGQVILLDALAHPFLQTDRATEILKGRVATVFGSQRTPLTDAADLLLPTATWLETEGTLTSSTGRVQIANQGRPPGGLSRPAWRILVELGSHLGVPLSHLDRPRAIFEDMTAEIPAFAGMAYRRLATEPGIPVLEEVNHVG